MKKKEEKRHNGNISIWKFIFALLILVHHCIYLYGYHSKLFVAASIGVEFFFIVSGYLLAKKVYQEDLHKDKRTLYQATLQYIFKKIKSFLPYLLFAYFIYVLIDIIFTSHGLTYWLQTLYSISLIQMAGTNEPSFVSAFWYLSGLILGMSIIYPLLKTYKKNFSCLWAPIIAIFILGFLLHPINGRYYLRTYSHWYGFAYVGMLRAIMELLLGVIAYELCEKIKTIKFSKIGSLILSLIQIGCFGLVIIANSLWDKRSLDGIYILLILIGVIIGFSENTLFFEKCNNKIFYYLEKLSLPIFLNTFIFQIILSYLKLADVINIWYVVLLNIVLTILFAIFELWILPYILKLLNYIKNKFLKVIILN